ncbi:MAG: hypothetical protein K1X52_11535 [Pyrinomonadaceae bacterium]|nr:hypothetical protein [Pyrinomonadaceae bacterium]
MAERVNDVWRFSIYDIGGKIVAEYGGVAATDEGGVKYLLSDWQGSTRAVLSNGGFVTARMDYTAYGENIGAGVGLRTAALGYSATSADSLRQRYGLTERDDATGLDHTWFRKLENRSGRWTSPDPYNGSTSVGDPQSFNRFSYVANQPTNFIDPSGLLMMDSSQNRGYCVRYHYYNPSTGESFWGQWQCSSVGGMRTLKDVVREQLEYYLKVKSLECEKALKALQLTDKQILNGFDRNSFRRGATKNGAEATTFFPLNGQGPTWTVSQNGIATFLGQSMGFLIHELAHAVLSIGDPEMYTRLLSAQNMGNISGLPTLGNGTTASQAISRYLNKACGRTDQMDSPLPSSGGSGATSA